MADSVLLLATEYDAATFYTRSWAQDLREQLLRRKHTCLMLEVESLCYAGRSLTDAIERVDHVVFYGHGLTDQWTAMPSGHGANPLPLVDLQSVHILDGRKIYAGCCDSLGPAGATFPTLGALYTKQFPNGAFIGYRAQFEFEFSNHSEFGDVVNNSVINYVSGDSANKVAQDLAVEWDNLRHDFSNGRLRNKPNAVMAAHRADNNRQRVDSLP
jgi:hypothetical protein